MATWVYRCQQCQITFAAEVEDGATTPETGTCPQCGDSRAPKQFETRSLPADVDAAAVAVAAADTRSDAVLRRRTDLYP